MTREHEVGSYLSESFLQGCFENSEFHRLMKVEHGRELDLEGLRKFLEEFEDGEEIIQLIIKLNKEGMLPDFIVKDSETVFFVEIKTKFSDKKVKLTEIGQKENIKKLADERFECWILIDRTDYGQFNEPEIKELLKEKGQFDKNIYPNEKLVRTKITLNSFNEKKVYPGVFMVDVEIENIEKN
jgi:hypothetical protein